MSKREVTDDADKKTLMAQGEKCQEIGEERNWPQVIINCFSESLVMEKLRNGMGAREGSKCKRFLF